MEPSAARDATRLSAPICRHEARLDVRGFQITMNDPLLVRGFQRLGDLLRDRQRLIERNGAACDALRQIVAFNEFHHERGNASGFLDRVDRSFGAR